MSMVKDLETKLAGVFKGAPAMPASGKESLVKAWPAIAAVFGVIQVLVALGLWHLVRATTALSNYYYSYVKDVTGQSIGLSSTDKALLYLGIIFLLVDAVILLMAVPKLQKRAKAGWDLLFLGALLNTL